MGDFNKVMVLGRLTRDPEVRYTPSGVAVCDLAIATNRRIPAGGEGQWKDETTYVDVTLWRRQAEVAGQYLGKGREVFIEGYLSMDTWEDKTTGAKRSKLKVVCDNLQLIGGGGGGQGGGGSYGGQQGGSYGGSQGGGGQQPAYQNDGYSDPAQSAQPAYQAPAPSYDQPAPAPQAAPAQSAPPAQPAYEPEQEDDIPF